MYAIALLDVGLWIQDRISIVDHVPRSASKTFTKIGAKKDFFFVSTIDIINSLLVMFKSYGLVQATTAIQGGATAICDIIVSVAFIYLFRSQRSGHARWVAYHLIYCILDFANVVLCFSKTNTLINKMIKYAVNRAVATSFCAVAGVLLVRFQ